MLNKFIMFRLICRKGESWARDTCISLPMLFLKLQNKLASHCLYVQNVILLLISQQINLDVWVFFDL